MSKVQTYLTEVVLIHILDVGLRPQILHFHLSQKWTPCRIESTSLNQFSVLKTRPYNAPNSTQIKFYTFSYLSRIYFAVVQYAYN